METKITNKAIQRYFETLYKEVEIEGRPCNGGLLHQTRVMFSTAVTFGTNNLTDGIGKTWARLAAETDGIMKMAQYRDKEAVKAVLCGVLEEWERQKWNRERTPKSYNVAKLPLIVKEPDKNENAYNVCVEKWEQKPSTDRAWDWLKIFSVMDEVMAKWQAYYDKPVEAAPSITDKRRGRPTKDFKENILVDDREAVLEQMRSLITGRTNREVALIIRAYMSIGYLIKPTFSQVEAEFGKIGNRSGYNKYMNDGYSFSDDEFSGAVQAIKK